MSDKDIKLMAHLMRRAGFGATREELESHGAKGYEATVKELLELGETRRMPDDLAWRFHPEQGGLLGSGADPSWLYRLISTDAPFLEKMALFWHRVFATSIAKLTQGKVIADQIRMLRRHGMGSFRTLLVELSRSPAMIVWLDNYENHKGAINENFGRELLELFSMGVGNYTEDDIKECARAFTGWTLANTKYMAVRAERDSIWPYGRIAWRFEYRPEDHDNGEKTFLGETGRFNGEDIIEIICKQPATARFISRHLYHYFVADEPPVPSWPYTPPRDPEAIERLSEAYFESEYDIKHMLRVLFNSDFFKSEECWYEKVKSPAEWMVGLLRLSGEFDRPRHGIHDRSKQMGYMGQMLVAPPSVEGWHEGTEWIDSGTLVERLNFASDQLGDVNKPGVRAMVERIVAEAAHDGGVISPEELVDGCLEQMGAISVSAETRVGLVEFASREGALKVRGPEPDEEVRRRVADVMKLASATPEFQRA